MSDPFLITSPTVVANSGGATSGMNLWLHLQANGGTLTGNGRCVMTNTGWENRATFDFLTEQERRWGAEVVVLEFEWRKASPTELAALKAKADRADQRLERFSAEPVSFFATKRERVASGSLFGNPPTATQRKGEACRKATEYAESCRHSLGKAELVGLPSYRRVTLATASTDGTPFNEFLEGLFAFRTRVKGEPPVLPNGGQRLCTGHLKMRTSCQFARATWGCGPSGYECRLGLRSDEAERIASAVAAKSREAGIPRFPLDDAGITKADVRAFWDKQPFRLSLKAHEGNCTGCYMKRREALVDLIRRDFFDVSWWSGWESRTGQRFRDTRSFRGLEVASRTELSLLPPDEFDNAIECETGYCSN